MFVPRLDKATLANCGLSWREGFLIRDERTVLLDQERPKQTAEFMKSRRFLAIEINQSLGYPGTDISCLRNFSFLRCVHIIHNLIPDITPVHSLTELEDLSMQTYWKTPIDLRRFQQLSRCRIMWCPGAPTVFECPRLQWLFLDYFKSKDLGALTQLRRLRHLAISNSPIEDLSPIEELPPLKELRLINLRKLTDLEPLRQQTDLELLEIDGSRKLTSIDALAGMTELHTLYLCNAGGIESFHPLSHMKNLKCIYAWGDTNIMDGDVDILTRLPKLKKVAFMDRKHYSHTREKVEAQLRASRRSA